MKASITIRGIDPVDKSWLQRRARQEGISMEEFMRRLIHDNRTKSERHVLPSKVFAEYFGEENGIELPSPSRYGYRPLSFRDENEE